MENGSTKLENGNPNLKNQNSKVEGQSPVPSFEFPVSSGLPADRASLKYFIMGVAAVIVMVALAIVVSRTRTRNSSTPAELTPEQKSYLSNLSFAGAKVSAATNFLEQRVIYLDAEVTNKGTRAVSQVEISMEFTDVLGQVILRERAGVLPPASLPLKAGETRAFQLFFDRMPSDWNQAPPRITPSSVQFD